LDSVNSAGGDRHCEPDQSGLNVRQWR
jgi:hypothetical protein